MENPDGAGAERVVAGADGAGRPGPAGRAISRRRLLGGAAAAAAASAVGAAGWSSVARAAAAGTRTTGGSHTGAAAGAKAGQASEPTSIQKEALRVLGRTRLRAPDSLPDPRLPAGTDNLAGISNIVILMMENHSYDNFLGMLGRGKGQRPRGDGFTIGRSGRPTASNPYADGRIQHAFRMPTTCQLSSQPTQEWKAGHVQYAGGKLDGFVVSGSGPVAMGYWTGEDLPFTYSLASAFPLADRWFCSVLGQTDPNRRYLIAATSAGMTDDIGSDAESDTLLATPLPAGTIFNRLDDHGITWTDYVASYPTGATPELYPVNDGATTATNHKSLDQFFADAAAGKLPQVSLIDPDYDTQSQENPQNIVVGEALMARVVKAVASGPQWRETLLVITYDEHGGYYDHVPPPVALAPDSIPPVVLPGESPYDGFERYGFRVPGLVVSPYARWNHVTHTVHDHTSILAMIERKWNLPALTYRDANANDLTDFLDMAALAARRPTFPELPKLAAPGDTAGALACSTTGPGRIPPPGSISPG